MAALKQSLCLIKAELGIDCPRVVMLLDALGDTCVESGLLAKAATFYERAHTIDSKIAGRRDSDAITRLGKIQTLSGRVGSRSKLLSET